MAILQLRSNRKSTGGRYKRVLVKRLARLGRLPSLTSIGKTKAKSVRTIGGNSKEKTLRTDKVNLYDPTAKTHEVVEMKNTIDNPANRHYVRRNILTKGSVIEPTKGKAKITSRPGQGATVNATLV